MATLNLRLDPTQMERGAERGRASLKLVSDQAAKTESAIDRISKSASESANVFGAEMDRLRAKFDPVFAASKRYEANLDELNRAHKVGALSSQQYEAALERLNLDFERASSGARSVGVAAGWLGTRLQAARGQIQNAAFQLGDFATQVGAGTAASVALGQQLPQLLGGFGALGAVMGAVVAIGVPLAANLLDIGQNANDLEQQFADLEESLDRLEAAVHRASSAGREDLVESFGAVTASIMSLVEAEKQLSLARATRELQDAQDAIAGFGDTGASGRRGAILGEAAIAIERLRYQFDIAAEDAERLYAAFQQVENAQGPQEMVDAYVQIRELLVDAVGGWENLTAEQQEFIGHLNSAQTAAERMVDQIDKAEESTNALTAAAGLVAGGFSTALPILDQIQTKANSVATHLTNMLAKYTKLAQPLQMPAGIVFGGSDPNNVGAGTTLDMGDGTTHTIRTAEEIADAAEKAARAVGGGGSSGASRIDQTAQAYQRLIASLDPAVRAAQDYAEAQDTIAAAQRAGIITADEAARAYGLAQEEYEEMIGRMKEEASDLDDITNATSDAFGQLFDGIIDGGTEAADVLNNLAAQLIKMGLQSALSGAFPSLFGDGGFLSFDGGGYTGSGSRTGGVDGKGGFPAILHPNETVVDHTKAANSGGGSGVSVQVNNFADNTETRQRRQSGPNGEEVVIDIVNKGAAEGRLTGVQSRYNLQNQKVRR